jgi:hypothetical protein
MATKTEANTPFYFLILPEVQRPLRADEFHSLYESGKLILNQ